VTTIADTFAQIADDAMALDLPALRATIRATADDGLRAASYDGPTARSATVSSHPERAALNPRRDPSWADLDRIDHLEARFTRAIYELATRSHSGPFPTDWRSATLGARRLVTDDSIAVLDRTGQKPARFVLIAGVSVHDLELIGRRHASGRKPTEDEQNWERTNPNDVCSWHREIHDRHRRPRLPGKNVCQVCADLASLLGQKPPRWLLEAEVDMREPRPVAWRAALSRCMDELGVVRDRSA
jgi:hypothetical protein